MRPLLALFALAAAGVADDSPLLLQKPTLSKTHIVFAYAGDLWSVPRAGRRRRASHQRKRQRNRPGVFTRWHAHRFHRRVRRQRGRLRRPRSGGVPKRLTWHPAPDRVLGWTPDGKRVIFSSPRTAYSRFAEMFTVPADGGVEEELPFPSGYEASMSPDGQSIAYGPHRACVHDVEEISRRPDERASGWPDLSDSSVTKIPRTNSNDFNPMWAGDRVFFLSDRNGPTTLFFYDTKTSQSAKPFRIRGWTSSPPRSGPDAIVYEQFGGISLYDLKSGKTKPVRIRVEGDFAELRTRLVNVGKHLITPALSPNGARAVFAARGDIITVPAEKGDPRNLTNTPGVMEREPQWSPDGKSIAYLSDESGEYALHVRPQNGAGEVTKIELKPGFYLAPRYSPDSKKIALVDSFQRLWYVDLETKKQVEIAQDTYQMRSGNIAGAWSPDSKWLAYSRVLPNELSAIYLYSLADAKSTQVTDGMSDATNPVFDKDGKYLYFTASTNSGRVWGWTFMPWSGPRPARFTWRCSTKRCPLRLLRKATKKKPLTTRSPPRARKAIRNPTRPRRTQPKPAEGAKPKAGAPNVKIDLDGIDQRILSVPMPRRRYTALQVGKAGILLAVEAAPAALDGAPDNPPGQIVHRYDLKTRKSDVPLTGVNNFQMSFGGEKALYRQGEDWIIAALGPMAEGHGGGAAKPPAGAEHGVLKTVKHRSSGGSSPGMETDVPRSVAHRALLVLRSQHPRPGSERGGEEVRALPPQRRSQKRPHLFVSGDVGQHGGESHGNGRRRSARGEARRDRTAGGGLRGRQREIPVSTGL